MADKHPYMSGGGALTKAIEHLRRSLPATIDASILKKLGLAPKNESYLINILQFIGVIEEDGTPTDKARSVFTQHDDIAFAQAFCGMIKSAYSDLFSLHGDKAWALDQSGLVTYFRQTDKTSAVVGTRQATTFQTLSELCGQREGAISRPSSERKDKPAKEKVKRVKKAMQVAEPNVAVVQASQSKKRDLGLTVRIEINLPASGDQETYDRIFKSIRENLLNV
jgi:hypothetical protein